MLHANIHYSVFTFAANIQIFSPDEFIKMNHLQLTSEHTTKNAACYRTHTHLQANTAANLEHTQIESR